MPVFVPVKVEDLSREIPEGSVVGFNPPSGTIAQPGALVDVIVSQGWSQVEIPFLIGLEVQAVVIQLESVGFEVEVQGDGETVESINPAPGELHPYGAHVVISTGESEESESAGESEGEVSEQLES